MCCEIGNFHGFWAPKKVLDGERCEWRGDKSVLGQRVRRRHKSFDFRHEDKHASTRMIYFIREAKLFSGKSSHEFSGNWYPNQYFGIRFAVARREDFGLHASQFASRTEQSQTK
jgi:hypothetical protein